LKKINNVLLIGVVVSGQLLEAAIQMPDVLIAGYLHAIDSFFFSVQPKTGCQGNDGRLALAV